MADDSNQLEHLRHSAAHLLAAAVKDLWPGAQNAIGPAIEDGFYQDFDMGEHKISEADFPKIEKRMRQLVKRWGSFEERVVSIEEVRTLFADNPYKLELAEEFAAAGKDITVNDPGQFLDLCRGGHLDGSREKLKHFKLLSIAGAYWRGNEKNKMLTRIYGTVFFTKEELESYAAMLEEAKKRDHRKLGKVLDLFTFSELVGPGLPLFTPRGTIIRQELERFVWSLQTPLGYQAVTIPHLAKPELYKTSGHWDKFKDDLFHVKGYSDEFVMKPMNCPHHTQIYGSRPRSYKDLPLRFAEVTTVYRDEQAGQLQGLTRVRSISQDDAHVFCRPDQIESEVNKVLSIVDQFYATFGLGLSFRLSLRDPQQPEKYLGSDEIWEKAEGTLRSVLQGRGADFVEAAGEAAFYGPKIDFMARDSLGRVWQMATAQLDFNMPNRFDLTYTDEQGQEQTPVMIHRAISGSLERFMGILIEHYAGNLPLWLSPTQVAVLPISDDQNEYAEKVAQELSGSVSPEGLHRVALRVEVDTRAESIGKKIRNAEMMKVPIMLIVGKKEVETQTVAVRSHAKGDEGAKPLAELQQTLQEQVLRRA